jgi:hypothetical protein
MVDRTTQGEASGTSSDNHNGASNSVPRFEPQQGAPKQGNEKSRTLRKNPLDPLE